MTIFLLRKARFFIMDQLLDILTEVNSDVDYETCDTLVDDGILDSFDIVSIVGELNDTFDINILLILYLRILIQQKLCGI